MAGALTERDFVEKLEKAGFEEIELHQREPVSVDDLRRTWIVGTPDEVIARLREYEAVGVERVMLQHHLYRDVAALELIASEVVPAFA